MPYDNNSDLYGDGPEAAPSSAGGQAGDDAMGSDGTTATLPKSIFAGKDPKPGEEWIFEVVRVHDDEVEVKYATGKGKDEGGEKEGGEKGKGDAEMQSLMEY